VNDSALLKTWLDIYAHRTHSELPAFEGRLKTVETEINTQTKRLENITSRLADLPKEVPADQIYKQIQAISEKVKELESTHDELKTQNRISNAGAINGSELLFRVKRTINNLEKVPVEDRRPIYSNLIKFAELHPTKIRLGVYAPTAPYAVSNFAAVSGLKSAGSCTVLNGAP
jgi:uncharacterized coiled-coil protein SlyX